MGHTVSNKHILRKQQLGYPPKGNNIFCLIFVCMHVCVMNHGCDSGEWTLQNLRLSSALRALPYSALLLFPPRRNGHDASDVPFVGAGGSSSSQSWTSSCQRAQSSEEAPWRSPCHRVLQRLRWVCRKVHRLLQKRWSWRRLRFFQHRNCQTHDGGRTVLWEERCFWWHSQMCRTLICRRELLRCHEMSWGNLPFPEPCVRSVLNDRY